MVLGCKMTLVCCTVFCTVLCSDVNDTVTALKWHLIDVIPIKHQNLLIIIFEWIISIIKIKKLIQVLPINKINYNKCNQLLALKI